MIFRFYIPIHSLLKAHCHAFVTKHFVETVVKSRMDYKVQSALTSLCKLYAVHGIVENLGGFIQVCYLCDKFNVKNQFFCLS